MFDSEPKVDSNGYIASLITCIRIRKLDLNELHKFSEIYLSQDLEYEEITYGEWCEYGLMEKE